MNWSDVFLLTCLVFALFVAYFIGRVRGWGLGFDEAARLRKEEEALRMQRFVGARGND